MYQIYCIGGNFSKSKIYKKVKCINLKIENQILARHNFGDP